MWKIHMVFPQGGIWLWKKAFTQNSGLEITILKKIISSSLWIIQVFLKKVFTHFHCIFQDFYFVFLPLLPSPLLFAELQVIYEYT